MSEKRALKYISSEVTNYLDKSDIEKTKLKERIKFLEKCIAKYEEVTEVDGTCDICDLPVIIHEDPNHYTNYWCTKCDKNFCDDHRRTYLNVLINSDGYGERICLFCESR